MPNRKPNKIKTLPTTRRHSREWLCRTAKRLLCFATNVAVALVFAACFALATAKLRTTASCQRTRFTTIIARLCRTAALNEGGVSFDFKMGIFIFFCQQTKTKPCQASKTNKNLNLSRSCTNLAVWTRAVVVAI